MYYSPVLYFWSSNVATFSFDNSLAHSWHSFIRFASSGMVFTSQVCLGKCLFVTFLALMCFRPSVVLCRGSPISATTTTVQIHIMSRNTQLRKKTAHHYCKMWRSVNPKKSQELNLSPSSVAKTIKRFDETASHEERPRKGWPRANSVAEDTFVRIPSLRNHLLTAPHYSTHK